MSDGDLVAFLTARLDEDERIARSAWDEKVHLTLSPAPRVQVRDWAPDDVRIAGSAVPAYAVNAHIARQDPVRVLRDVAADRKLIAALGDVGEFSDPWIGLDLAVRIRAERFSGHPDYRAEWKP